MASAAWVVVNRTDELLSCLNKIFESAGINELTVAAKQILPAQDESGLTGKMFTEDNLPLNIVVFYLGHTFRIAGFYGMYTDPISNEQKKFRIKVGRSKDFSTNINAAVIQNYTIVAKRTQNFVTIKKEDVQTLRF